MKKSSGNSIGNPNDGRTAAVIHGLIATAKTIGVDPRTYLREVLLRIASESGVATATPHGWKERWSKVALDHRNSIL